MLSADVFSHTGFGGSSPGDRMEDAGYVFAGGWTWGENIAWSGTTGTVDAASAITGHHEGLFNSSGHRLNLLNDSFREIGIAQELGQFTASGRAWNASMATQAFATSGSSVFLTGVAYADQDRDAFYSIGEGRGGTVFAIGTDRSTTEAAGGYALATSANAAARVEVTKSGKTSIALVDLTGGNVKLDLVDGALFRTSGDLTLVSGVKDAELLGAGALNLLGSAVDNHLTGNAGANLIKGANGGDVLSGGAGNDRLNGGSGLDTLGGDAGRDKLTGGGSADAFQFGAGDGADTVADFNRSAGDSLVLDNDLWSNSPLTAAEVVARFASVAGGTLVFDFGDGDRLTLTGVGSTTGIAAQIDFV